VDLFIRSGSRVDPYLHFLVSDPPVEWQKVWFFLRNDADAPLPLVTSSCLIPHSKWGHSVARGCIHSLQPLRDVVQRQLRGGLMGADLLRTFVSPSPVPLREGVVSS
jgi:hypothetical protein